PQVECQAQPVVRSGEACGEHEAGHAFGVAGGGADGDGRAEREADDREPLGGGFGDECVGEDVEVQRRVVAREVGAGHLVALGQERDEAAEVRFDAAARAVGEDDAGAGAGGLG
ncbi:hypothetical protein ADL26_18125, partial [Thermoactinomyces vulgaris]